MERVAQKFATFEEAEAADRAYYRSLTPAERLSIMIDLITQRAGMRLQRDLREFIELLNSANVERNVKSHYCPC